MKVFPEITRETAAPTHRSADLWTDGSCPANPGPMGIGFHFNVFPENDGSTGYQVMEGFRLGPGTNNVAEYLALIAGLRSCIRHAVSSVSVCSDSLLVVNQVKGVWECKDFRLNRLLEEAKGLAALFTYFKISHIPREENRDADILSKNPTDPAALPPDVELDLNPPKARKMSRFDAARIRYWWVTRKCQNEYRLQRLFGGTKSHMGRIGRGEQYADVTEGDLRRAGL